MIGNYTGPVTIDSHAATADLAVTAEPVLSGVGPIGEAIYRPLYSWGGTLQLASPEDAGALLVRWGDGRRTLTLADGRTAEVVQRSVDSFGQVEILGLGPAPWWTRRAP